LQPSLAAHPGGDVGRDQYRTQARGRLDRGRVECQVDLGVIRAAQGADVVVPLAGGHEPREEARAVWVADEFRWVGRSYRFGRFPADEHEEGRRYISDP